MSIRCLIIKLFLMIIETQILNVVIKPETLEHIFRELSIMIVVNHNTK